MNSIKLNFSYNSGTLSAPYSIDVTGTGRATCIYEGGGQTEPGSGEYLYVVRSIDNKTWSGASSGTVSELIPWQATDIVTLPADFYNATSAEGDWHYIHRGRTAQGVTVNAPSSASEVINFLNAVGPNGTITCQYSGNAYISGSWHASASDLTEWNPDIGDSVSHLGLQDRIYVTTYGTGTCSGAITGSDSSRSSLTISYLTEVEFNRGTVEVTLDKPSINMGESITATTTISGTEFSYYTIEWLLNGRVVESDSTHYTTNGSHISNSYTEDVVRRENNLGAAHVVAYALDGSLLCDTVVNFAVIGPEDPPTIFNIENFGVAVGQMAEGTEANPKFTVNYPTEFHAKITAKHGFVISDGWHPLTLASGISTYDCGVYGPGAAYCVEGGNHVYVSAGVGNFISSSATNGGVIIASDIPEAYRPTQPVYCLAYCQRSSSGTGAPRIYRCVVTPEGTVKALIEYHTDSSSGITENIKFLDIFCDYWV